LSVPSFTTGAGSTASADASAADAASSPQGGTSQTNTPGSGKSSTLEGEGSGEEHASTDAIADAAGADDADNDRTSVAASDDDFVNTLSPASRGAGSHTHQTARTLGREGDAAVALSPPSPYPSRFGSRANITSPLPAVLDEEEEEVEVDDEALRNELQSPPPAE
jgi:hypothetical protein